MAKFVFLLVCLALIEAGKENYIFSPRPTLTFFFNRNFSKFKQNLFFSKKRLRIGMLQLHVERKQQKL